MGTQHVQSKHGVVFSAPTAAGKGFSLKYKSRMVGTIVLNDDGNPNFVLGEGNWLDQFHYANVWKDPHKQDQTGFSITQGTFYSFNRDLEHYAVGSPNANNLQGRVYICHDCFGTLSYKNGRTLQASHPQIGERYGAAMAAVDINGDSVDDIVVGAPFHSFKVITFK